MTNSEAGPFRSYPWPLEVLRTGLRFARLQRVKASASARFVHGNAISFAKGADIRAPHFVEMGHHISFGKNFTSEVDMRIGNYVLISSNVSFIGRDHPFEDPMVSVYSASRDDSSLIEIGSDVLVGFGAIIVGTTIIGDGCIIGAGSVVTRNLPPYTVCAGVPAKPIRNRYSHNRRDAP